ncbi:unnamed protein product [Medioppia subpectinata]|uniref:Tubulin--tyrosine ligase-like protein 12 SET-like domain-containing protein n=1 Tax=Medioppia subpectinata TaxID=1979941 RepID=A0A7R9KHV2_9ACAR|nr:unnamed protein product [Medioppia subpectinata]CAG2103519.1 unnamed protein product [Medioppia subpectinata]
MNGQSVLSYEDFVSLHSNQLQASEVPQIFWPKLYDKLLADSLDSGLDFRIDAIVYNEDDDEDVDDVPHRNGSSDPQPNDTINIDANRRVSDTQRSYRVVCIKEEGIDVLSDTTCDAIYLIDHMITYRCDQIHDILLQTNGLIERLSDLFELKFDDIEDRELMARTIAKELWKWNQCYSIESSEVENSLPVWYLMDEFGSRIQHSTDPNFRCVPFYFIPRGIAYSLLFPIKSVSFGEEVTRNYIEGSLNDEFTENRDLLSTALMHPWIGCDLSEVDANQTEPNIAFIRRGRVEESYASEVPQTFWPKLYDKLLADSLDSGLDFRIDAIVYNEEDDEDVDDVPHMNGSSDPQSNDTINIDENRRVSDTQRSYRVVCIKEEGIDVLSDTTCDAIYLIDHMITYRCDQIHDILLQTNGLIDRLSDLFELKFDDIEDRELMARTVAKELWKWNQCYSIESSEVENSLPVWYLMDEFGSRIQHSTDPNFRCVPFYFIPRGIAYSLLFPIKSVSFGEEVTRIAYSLLFPIKSVSFGEEVTRNYIEGSLNDEFTENRDLLSTALMHPWIGCDLSEVDANQTEPNIAFIRRGRVEESYVSMDSTYYPELPQNRKIKVYSHYKYINEYLSHESFEITDSTAEADILWLSSHFKEFKELLDEKPNVFINQGIAYSLLFPIKSVSFGEEVTRNYIEGSLNDEFTENRDLLSTALMHPWIGCDLSEVDANQTEPNIAFIRRGRVEESYVSMDSTYYPKLPQNRKMKVYSHYKYINEYLSHESFEITDSTAEADILWLSSHFKEFKELFDEKPNVFINQFPFEHIITVKDLFAIVCRRKNSTHSVDENSLSTRPEWLATTYNLQTEIVKFVAYFQKRAKRGLDNHWICKPWNLARSLDTQITDSLDCIIRLRNTVPKVVCKYITEPVLFRRNELNGALVKFDIRYIVLLRSVSPLEVYVYKYFWLRFSNKAFSLDNFDDYEKHFTVMNYKTGLEGEPTPDNQQNDIQFKQMFCSDFIDQFNEQYGPDYCWTDVERDIYKTLKEVFECATSRPPPHGIGHNLQSRALYGVDVMLKWQTNSQTEAKRIQPVVLEMNWAPDCERACLYYNHFYNDIFSTLFLNDFDPNANNVILL